MVSDSFTPSSSPVLSASPVGAELAWVRRQLDEARRKIRRWEESWQRVEQVSMGGGGPLPQPLQRLPALQACAAWQRAAREAKERALEADSARRLALQKKQEVEAQFRRLQEELEGCGPARSLPGLRGCGKVGDIPLPQLHSLQSQLRLDLEAVDGVSPAACQGPAQNRPHPSPHTDASPCPWETCPQPRRDPSSLVELTGLAGILSLPPRPCDPLALPCRG